LCAAANSPFYSIAKPTAILDAAVSIASTSGGGGREAVSSWHGIGHHLVGFGPIARLLRRCRYSTTEMGTERGDQDGNFTEQGESGSRDSEMSLRYFVRR